MTKDLLYSIKAFFDQNTCSKADRNVRRCTGILDYLVSAFTASAASIG